MKKIATDKIQSAILRDMIGVESADMVWISGAPSQLCVIDGEYVKRENLDEYDTFAYSLDALIDIICSSGGDVDFHHTSDCSDHWVYTPDCFDKWKCRWSMRVQGNKLAHLSRIGKTKVDAAFEVVVSLCKEGYIKEDHAER